MSHTITISDEAYHALRTIAGARGQTAEALVETWAAEQVQYEAERDPRVESRYYTPDEFLRRLGMSNADIRLAEELIARGDEGEAGKNTRYETFEDFFRDLGMSDEEIRQAKEQAASEDADV